MSTILAKTAPSVPAPSRVRRRRALLVLVALLLIGGIGAALLRRGGEAPQTRRGAGQPVPVLVAAAQQQDVPIYLDGLGTVQAFYSVTVRPMIDGPLSEVDFREGQDVHVGDVLARIDPRPYQATLDQAVAKKAQDEASLANARLDLVRYQKLVATAYTSAQTADTQRATVAQDEAQVKQDQASIDSARTQLSYTTITSPIEGRTGIRQVDPGNIVHTTDTNGLVVITTLRPISVLFTLPQQTLSQITTAMQASAAQGSAGQGGAGQGGAGQGGAGHGGKPEVLAVAQGDPTANTAADGAGDAAAGAADAGPKVLDRGTLEVLDNEVDSTTGTLKLKATFPNPNLTLWPGGFVNVRLLVRTQRNAITVPPVAIQRGPQGPYVYVLEADQTVSRRNVTVGHEDLQASIVTGGLKPGEQVVVDGASRLTDKAKVSVASPQTTAAPTPPPAPHQRRRRNAS